MVYGTVTSSHALSLDWTVSKMMDLTLCVTYP